jgi:hypothetical protein
VTDTRLHGRRFVLIEFGLATVIAATLAVVVLVLRCCVGAHWAGTVGAVLFFVGVGVNSVADLR